MIQMIHVVLRELHKTVDELDVPSNSSEKANVRSVNLLDLRQSQNNLSPVPRHIVLLARVTLKIHRLELLERC